MDSVVKDLLSAVVSEVFAAHRQGAFAECDARVGVLCKTCDSVAELFFSFDDLSDAWILTCPDDCGTIRWTVDQ